MSANKPSVNMEETHQEQGQSVQGQTETVESSAIQPDLVILERLEHLGPEEMLRVDGITVGLEACVQKRLLFVGQKLDLVGPVFDKPEAESCNHACCDSFL